MVFSVMALLYYGVYAFSAFGGFKEVKGLFRCCAGVDNLIERFHDGQWMGMLPYVSSQVDPDGPLLESVINEFKYFQSGFAFGTAGNDHRHRASHGDLFKAVMRNNRS